MSTPEQRAIDPFSQALGRIEGRLDGMDKRFDSLEQRLDRFEALMLRLVGGLYLLVVLGFSGLAWLSRH